VIKMAVSDTSDPVLRVTDLRVGFRADERVTPVVDGVSFTLNGGEVLALVGESGCGKSVTVMTIMGLTKGSQTEISGNAWLGDGTDLIAASERQMESIRGNRVALISQDPLAALTPVYRVGDHISEQILAHERVSKKAARSRAIDLLAKVGIAQPEARARAYPHEFSGGMRQRVMIAMALACSPEILIADEPTTALDVTIQSQILDELADLRRETGVAILLITHDLAVVAEVADRVAVMYAGQIVEQTTTHELFHGPLHPYTTGLLGSIPRISGEERSRLVAIPGAPPSFARLPDGCRFKSRCPHRAPVCEADPELTTMDAEPAHAVRCHLASAYGTHPGAVRQAAESR
jgi:peptide/nickel transport system ATP-binding protein